MPPAPSNRARLRPSGGRKSPTPRASLELLIRLVPLDPPQQVRSHAGEMLLRRPHHYPPLAPKPHVTDRHHDVFLPHITKLSDRQNLARRTAGGCRPAPLHVSLVIRPQPGSLGVNRANAAVAQKLRSYLPLRIPPYFDQWPTQRCSRERQTNHRE